MEDLAGTRRSEIVPASLNPESAPAGRAVLSHISNSWSNATHVIGHQILLRCDAEFGRYALAPSCDDWWTTFVVRPPHAAFGVRNPGPWRRSV